MEEYLGARQPDARALQQRTLGFQPEKSAQMRGREAKAKQRLQGPAPRPGAKAKSKGLAPKLRSSRARKRAPQSSKKKAMLAGEFPAKKSKWGAQTGAPTQYEKWKRGKRELRQRHLRKHSKQLFRTLKENCALRPPSEARAKAKELAKGRKKLSIEVCKPGLDFGQPQKG